MFYRWDKETPEQVYLRQPQNLQWTEYTWAQVADQVRRIAGYLKSKGYPDGSRIAIWSSNSKDWPIYPGQDTGSANHVFNHS